MKLTDDISNKVIVAIDGYSSCGKSTLAKSLAQHLGYVYVDSGAMYRAATYYCMQQGLIHADGSYDSEALTKAIAGLKLTQRFNPQLQTSETILNGESVESAIRTLSVSNLVSKVSAIKGVRLIIAALQREMGEQKGVVMDGRDIGTNVFPNAEVKIFMTASIAIRVQRRYDELKSKGADVTPQEIEANLQLRDYDDTHRSESPLLQARDAVVLDNSNMTRAQQLKFVEELVLAKLNK